MPSTRKTAYLQATIYADVKATFKFPYPNYPLAKILAVEIFIKEFEDTDLAFTILSRLSLELREVILDLFPVSFVRMSMETNGKRDE